MIKNKSLTFEPTIFRDWSIAYCELAYISATREFKKQFSWKYSDLIFLWDGKKETLYRAREEHIHGMFSFITKKINKDKNFMRKISKELLVNMKEYETLLTTLLNTDLNKLKKKEVLSIFRKLKRKYIPLLPKFLIIMYFPQQIEKYYQKYKNKYAKEFQICLETRPKVDKILAPFTEKFLRKLDSFVLKGIGIKFNKKYSQFLTLEEIDNILDNKYSQKQLNNIKKEIKNRNKYFLFAKGNVRYISLKEYIISKRWNLAEQIVEKEDLVRGNSAYISKNPVVGVVKIVQNSKELSKVKKGDVIVAPMTTPEYGPVFQKVSAIITDEGGITSHAAIISREMAIPSIIGTKIASQVFNDGDYVEVDTSQGVVKKITKQEFKKKIIKK